MNRKDFEIMAPVGSYESLHAAISAGANSIYFGVEGLNMRAGSAANFTLDDLRNIASICNEAGVKTYLTVNTILFDNDIEKCREIITTAHAAGVSAIIASDPAAMMIANETGIACHASTQLNISNTEAVKFYSRFCDVVVLAREVSLEQVSEIYRHICEENICGPSGKRVRIEMFCHGALCMAVSGKCYLSLHEANSSANRGSCRQICRRAYTVTDKETGAQLDIENQYVMSPKDLKTIHFLNRMVEAGVRVFKIEGRARGPEYVKLVTECYSDALDAICNNEFNEDRVKAWDEKLTKVFNRGFWDGYYLGQRLGEWSSKYGSSATRVKRYVAKGVRYYGKLGVGEFYAEAGEVKVGDEVVITGPTTGALITTVTEIHNTAGEAVDKVGKGELFSIAVPEKIRPSDRLYVWDVK